MVHRYFSISLALALILASSSVIEGAEVKGLRIPNHSADTSNADNSVDDFVNANELVEKGIKCNGSADRKKGAGRTCEGGVKQVRSVSIGPKDLAEDISDNVRDLHSDMMLFSSGRNNLFVTEESMAELMNWDSDHIFDGEDCSLEGDGKGCGKMVEFGGYAKVFWGCNITFSKNDRKMSKEIDCGGKTFEGMGKAEAKYYKDAKEKEVIKTADNSVDDFVNANESVGKGIQCKGHADKKKGAGRTCKGGVKQVRSVSIGPKDLAEDISDNIRDLHSDMMMFSSSGNNMFVPEESMVELINWDNDNVIGGEDCSLEDDGKGCKKRMEFGGMAKVLWGCKIIFSKKGKQMSKEIDCGGSTVERMGKKEAMYYKDVNI